MGVTTRSSTWRASDVESSNGQGMVPATSSGRVDKKRRTVITKGTEKGKATTGKTDTIGKMGKMGKIWEQDKASKDSKTSKRSEDQDDEAPVATLPSPPPTSSPNGSIDFARPNAAQPVHVGWDGSSWFQVSGNGRVKHWQLQREWYPLSIQLFAHGKVADSTFHVLLSGTKVMDFRGPLPLEFPPMRVPRACLCIGAVRHLRVWSTRLKRNPGDASVVEADADTLVLLNKATPVNSPLLSPFHGQNQSPERTDLAVVPRPVGKSFPRVIVHLGPDMAPIAAYGFFRATEAVVLVVKGLSETDPAHLAELLALALIPAAGNGDDWYPVDCGIGGHVPHLTLIGDGPLTTEHAAALAKRFGNYDMKPTLFEYICAFSRERYGTEPLVRRFEMLTFEAYESRIGKETFMIEMGMV